VFSENSTKARSSGLKAMLCLGAGFTALTAFSAPAIAQEETADEARTLIEAKGALHARLNPDRRFKPAEGRSSCETAATHGCELKGCNGAKIADGDASDICEGFQTSHARVAHVLAWRQRCLHGTDRGDGHGDRATQRFHK
jgi:hypothetical protein